MGGIICGSVTPLLRVDVGDSKIVEAPLFHFFSVLDTGFFVSNSKYLPTHPPLFLALVTRPIAGLLIANLGARRGVGEAAWSARSTVEAGIE